MTEYSDIPKTHEITSKLYELLEPLRILRGSQLVEERFGDERRAQQAELDAIDLEGSPTLSDAERAGELIMIPDPLLRVPVPDAMSQADIQAVYDDSVQQAESELEPLKEDIEETINGTLWEIFWTCQEYSRTYTSYRQMLGEAPSGAPDPYTNRPQHYDRSDHSGIRAIEEVTSNWQGDDGALAKQQFGDAIRPAIEHHVAMTGLLAEAAAVELDARGTAHKAIYALLEEMLAKLVEEIDVNNALADGSLGLAGLSLATVPFPHVSLGLSIASFGLGIVAEVIPEGTTIEITKDLDEGTFQEIVQTVTDGLEDRREELRTLRDAAQEKLMVQFRVYENMRGYPELIPGVDLNI